MDNVTGDGSRKSSARLRDIDKYKGKVVFKVNEEGKYKVGEWACFVTLFRDENYNKLF